MNVAPYPTREQGTAIHVRLLAGDPVASRDLIHLYLERIVYRLGRRYPRANEDDCQSAANDAFMEYLHHPEKYDPSRRDLGGYLFMIALGDLSNSQRKQQRERQRIDSDFSVENAPQPGNTSVDAPLQQLIAQEAGESARRCVAEIRANCTPEEQPALDLMIAGERRTENYVAALNLGHLSGDEQQTYVNRMKDRLRRRIQRGASDDWSTGSDGESGTA